MVELDARAGTLPLRVQMLKIVMRLMHYLPIFGQTCE